MTNTGPAIKILRERRGYAPKQMYEGVMSRTNYGRFERGLIDTSSANFVTLIKRLDAHTLGWERLYRVLEKQTSGLETPTLPRLVPDHCEPGHAAAYRAAAHRAEERFATTHYPGWEHAQWLNLAFASYLEHGLDPSQTNQWVNTILAYLAQLQRWFSPDFALAAGLTGIISAADTVTIAEQYLAALQQAPTIEVANLLPRSHGEMLVLWMRAPVQEQDWPHYSRLLKRFNETALDQRELVPLLMRRLYQCFADYHDGQASALEPVAGMLRVVDQLKQPRLTREAHQAAAALRTWLAAAAPDVK